VLRIIGFFAVPEGKAIASDGQEEQIPEALSDSLSQGLFSVGSWSMAK
jgi:hypothetical protein